MSNVHTCTTPEEAWALYSHFLGNCLALISLCKEGMDKDVDEVEREKEKRLIDDTWAKLVGNLYFIMRRMLKSGYDDIAVKMQQIIDMTVDLDVTDPEVRAAIHRKHGEFDSGQSAFEALVAELNAKNG
jgi:hypothetical protein